MTREQEVQKICDAFKSCWLHRLDLSFIGFFSQLLYEYQREAVVDSDKEFLKMLEEEIQTINQLKDDKIKEE